MPPADVFRLRVAYIHKKAASVLHSSAWVFATVMMKADCKIRSAPSRGRLFSLEVEQLTHFTLLVLTLQSTNATSKRTFFFFLLIIKLKHGRLCRLPCGVSKRHNCIYHMIFVCCPVCRKCRRRNQICLSLCGQSC